MYSKLVFGLAMAGAATASVVKRDTTARDGAGGGHDHGHDHAHAAAPSSGYSEPAVSSGYAAPAQGYGGGGGGHSSSGYGAPSYGGGHEVYGGYEEEGGFDLTAIIIPILVIFGLSLLFPTITSVEVNNRRKREAGGASPMTDIVERVNDIYMSVVESEECMQRIACEIGGLAEDVGLKENSIARMADPLVPSKYKAYYKQFTSGQNCHKIKCGKLF